MSLTMTRREMLLAAGGVTFLGLIPTAGGYLFTPKNLETPTGIPPRPLLYTAAPYIQPGPASRLIANDDTMAVAWQTEDRPASFLVEFGENRTLDRQAPVVRTQPYRSGRDPVVNYVATATGLKLNTRYDYSVKQNGILIAEGYFTTRKPRGSAIRFVSFGDNSFGDLGQRGVAFHAYKSLPDFVMNTGDNVYDAGLNREYLRYFFPIYNSEVPAATVGAPLLRSVPFYTVLGNHDISGKGPEGKPASDFDKNPDALGYYSLMNLPASGPTVPQPTPLVGKADDLDHFRKNCDRFPRQANYSFDVGDVHFLCLDSNTYIDATDKGWIEYIAADLGTTDAKWKFVVYHHPAFNVGKNHYAEQHMRLFSPTFEKFGVDFVLAGHEHIYQRTAPLRFKPHKPGRGNEVSGRIRHVSGEFAVDRSFDGKTKTKPDGIVYITTGAGGRHLYDAEFHEKPDRWVRPEDGNVAYTSSLISDRHSFTLFDVTAEAVALKQIDQWGQEVDSIRVTKT